METQTILYILIGREVSLVQKQAMCIKEFAHISGDAWFLVTLSELSSYEFQRAVGRRSYSTIYSCFVGDDASSATS